MNVAATNIRKPQPLLCVQHFGAHEWGIVCRTFSKTVREQCKLTPGLKWDKARSAWWGYVDAVDAAAQRVLAKRIKLDVSALPKPEQDPNQAVLIPPLALEDLRDYQKQGVCFAVAHANEGVLIADDLGLGKSLQAIRAARALRGKTVVVVPAFLRSVWLKAIFGDKTVDPPTPVGWPHVKVQLLYGVKPVQKNVYDVRPRTKITPKRTSPFEETHDVHNDSPAAIDPDTTIVILNYEIVHAWNEVLIAWGAKMLIGDEAHMLSGDRSRRTRAVEALAKTCTHRVLLTGTPMLNRPRDLWGPINILSPWRFGHPHHYALRYCGAFQQEVAKDKIVWNCCTPEAPVWMGDCSFRPIGELRAGDIVIGWSLSKHDAKTGRYSTTKLVRTRVLAVHRRVAPVQTVSMASGRTIRCTPDHQWLTGTPVKMGGTRFVTAAIGRSTGRRTRGNTLASVVQIPQPLPIEKRRSADWLAGLYDGEGTATGGMISLAQSRRHNPEVCQAIENVLHDLNIPYSIYTKRSKDADMFQIRGGRQGMVDFLYNIRPVKRARIEREILQSLRTIPDTVDWIEPAGNSEVVSMTTETGNYVVWGYASKNCKGASNLDELRRRLSFFMIRRTKSDVAMQLPPRTRQILEIDVDRRFVVAIAAALKSDSALQNALGMAADGKLPDVANLVAGHVKAGSKVVVGTWRKVIAETLHDAFVQAGIDSALITGEISHAKRDEIIKREPQVVCATIDSIGVGVDMSYASVGVCAELSYVPSKLIQWEGRLFRFRQKNPTLFQYPIARGTADELIRDVLVSKLDVFEKGIGKTDDKLMTDLKGQERNPVEVLQDLYSRICKQREAQE